MLYYSVYKLFLLFILWISDFNEPVNLSIKLASDVSLEAKKQMQPLIWLNSI